jgi:dihydrofolate reductase
MRKIVLGLGINLDGYIARRDGAVDFLFMPKDYSGVPPATVDTAIMGRKTLDAGLKMSGGSLPPSSMAYYVFSHSGPPGKCDGWTFVNQSPAAFVRKLRKRPGKDIWLIGGGELARDFLKADLVDELYIGVVPVCWEKESRCSRVASPNATSLCSRTRPFPGALSRSGTNACAPRPKTRPSASKEHYAF